MLDKPLILLGSSRRDLRAFPALPRRLVGFQLRRVQQGLDPDDWKPMPTVGPGVREMRIHAGGAHRLFYVTTRAEAIYVLQAEAAKILRVTRPRVSDLLRGRIDLFSTDSLIDMLAPLGVGVRIVVKTPRSKKVA
jgi:phage-related protein